MTEKYEQSPGTVLPITATYQSILDAINRMWDSVPRDADGNKYQPVCDDDMPGYPHLDCPSRAATCVDRARSGDAKAGRIQRV
jgi:hypothetical protein